MSPSPRPAGFSPHLGWCHVTEWLWSPNASITSASGHVPTTPLWSPVPALLPSAELWTRPPHDSPSGTIDKVSQELMFLPKVHSGSCSFTICVRSMIFTILNPSFLFIEYIHSLHETEMRVGHFFCMFPDHFDLECVFWNCETGLK